MVEAVSTEPNLKPRKSSQNPTRPPLLPSETAGNNVAANRRQKPREVTSRYLSTSSSSSTTTSSSSSSTVANPLPSRRCATPIVSRARPLTPSPACSASKRSLSAERRRPATPRPKVAEMSAAAKMLASSRRCLSVSYQGESFSVSKSTPSSILRKGTPERRTTTPAVTTTPWPSRSREVSSLKSMSQSVDLGSVSKRVNGEPRHAVIRQSLPDAISSSRKRLFSGGVGKGVNYLSLNRSISTSESTSSETESLCSDNNDGPKGNSVNVPQGRGGPRGVIVPARFLQETSNRLRQVPEPRSPLSRSSSVKGTISSTPKGSAISRGLSPLRSNMRPPTPSSRPSTPLVVEKCNPSRGLASPSRARSAAMCAPLVVDKCTPSRGLASPSRARNVAMCAPLVVDKCTPSRGMASPSRARNAEMCAHLGVDKCTPSRGMFSPSRTRNAAMCTPLVTEKFSPSRATASPSRLRNATMGASSVSCFANVRRGKAHESKMDDAYSLRILYNRELQWQFANARAEASISLQYTNAERNLHDAWRATSDLRISVSKKKLELARLILKLKLTSILEKQMSHLDEWVFMEKDHTGSLLGAVESLKASTLRLPIGGGAVADIQGVKNAISSALDVLQAMASPICSLLSKAEQMNSLLSEMASIVANERALLDDCKDSVSSLATLQVKDCSLRTHILQLKQIPPSC